MAEMARVVTADGVVAICVPAGLDERPAYGPRRCSGGVGRARGPGADDDVLVLRRSRLPEETLRARPG